MKLTSSLFLTIFLLQRGRNFAVKNWIWSWEIAHSVKCLPFNMKTQVTSSDTHFRSWEWWHIHIWVSGYRKDSWGLLHSCLAYLASSASERSCLKNKGRWFSLSSASTCMSICTSTCTCSHVCTDIHMIYAQVYISKTESLGYIFEVAFISA